MVPIEPEVDDVSPALTQLLSEIFAADPCEFAVLRNGESLPGSMSGTDIDVSTLGTQQLDDVVAELTRRAHAAGWTTAMSSRRPHMVGISYLAASTEDRAAQAMHFDVFDGITFLGVELIGPDSLRSEATTRGGVRELSPRAQALATVVHHLAWNGGLEKQKYRDEIATLLASDDGPWLRERIEDIYGTWTLAEVEAGNLGDNRGARRTRVRRDLILRRLRQQPAKTPVQIARYLFGQLGSFVSPPGLVGEDGDGLPADPTAVLSLQVACEIAPHGFAIPGARAAASAASTVNGPRYEASLKARLTKTKVFRSVLPSVYLWGQAKRGRVVVLHRLPRVLRWLRAVRRPAWLCVAQTATSDSKPQLATKA